jgi:hypothetical protein
MIAAAQAMARAAARVGMWNKARELRHEFLVGLARAAQE